MLLENRLRTDAQGVAGMKIVAAVVTFDRRELLGRCIDHLQSQTRPPDQIIIINNSSTDGTVEMLRARGVSFITQENTGSAGGWRRSIQYAMDEGFDAVWLMDDDGFPHEAALVALEAAMTPDVVCASSVVLREDKPTHFVFPTPILDRSGLPVIFGVPRNVHTLVDLRAIASTGVYQFAHLFNGALVSVEAARTIGNVNPDFFIFGDEVDYFFRLRTAGKVISVLDAVQIHPDVSRRPYTPVKIYYYIKNSLILNARYLNAVPLRNLLTIVVALGRTANRNGLRAALSYPLGANAPVFYRGVVRGLRGVIGKDFVG
jgi:rhamnopyranosyl-N-acetylglucosaminyl-diphospho-decaprenol beta-1,3/1,4-galactofuranosyltransferase